MSRYRVTTPDTQRVPGKPYADFEHAQECQPPVAVRHLLARHGFIGCTVHRKRRGHWELIFDSSMAQDIVRMAARWRRVEEAQ